LAASKSSIKDKSDPSWRLHHDTEVNKSEVKITSNPRQSLAEKRTGIVDLPVPPRQKMAPVCFNCDSSTHLLRDCRAARVTCPICHKEGHLKKHHEASVRVKAYVKARHKEHQQSDKKVSKAETIMDSDGWSYSYMCRTIPPFATMEATDNDDEYVYDAPEYNFTQDPHTPESESFCYIAPRSDVAQQNSSSEAIIDSGSQDHVVSSIDLVSEAVPVKFPTGLIGIGGHRIQMTHTGTLALAGICRH